MKSQVHGSTVRETARVPRGGLKLQLKAQLFYCTLLVAAMASEGELALVMPADIISLILVGLFVVYVFVMVWCLVNVFVYGFIKSAVVGFAVVLLSGVVALVMPTVVLSVDWNLGEGCRNNVVERVVGGEIVPGVFKKDDLVKTNDECLGVFRGGRRVAVEEHDGKKYVMFNVKPVDSSLSGFLYVEGGGDPWLLSMMSDKYGEINPWKPGWYYVSCY